MQTAASNSASWKRERSTTSATGAFLDRVLDVRGLLAVELELALRDVRRHDARAEARELEREAAGAGAHLEHAVARPHELAQQPAVHLPFDTSPGRGFQARPLALAVLVEKARDQAGVVAVAHLCPK